MGDASSGGGDGRDHAIRMRLARENPERYGLVSRDMPQATGPVTSFSNTRKALDNFGTEKPVLDVIVLTASGPRPFTFDSSLIDISRLWGKRVTAYEESFAVDHQTYERSVLTYRSGWRKQTITGSYFLME